MIRIKLKGKNGNEEFINMDDNAISVVPSSNDHEQNSSCKNVKIVLKGGDNVLKETTLNQVPGFRILFNDDKLGDIIDVKESTKNEQTEEVVQLNNQIKDLKNQIEENSKSYHQEISKLNETIIQLQENLANEKRKNSEFEQKFKQQEQMFSNLKNDIDSSSSFIELSTQSTSPSGSNKFASTKSSSTDEIAGSLDITQREVTISIPDIKDEDKDQFPSLKTDDTEMQQSKSLPAVNQTTPNRKSSGAIESRKFSFFDFFTNPDDNSVSSLKKQVKEYRKSNHTQQLKIQELEELVHKLKRQNRHQQKYIKKLEDPNSANEEAKTEEKTVSTPENKNTSAFIGPWFVPSSHTSTFYTTSSHFSKPEPASLQSDKMRRKSHSPRITSSPTEK